jgi:hypothetical protein
MYLVIFLKNVLLFFKVFIQRFFWTISALNKSVTNNFDQLVLFLFITPLRPPKTCK